MKTGTCDQHTRYTRNCAECGRRTWKYRKARSHAIANGTWYVDHGLVDAYPVRLHLQECRDAGMTRAAISRASGISVTTLGTIARAEHPHVIARTATGILNIHPRTDGVPVEMGYRLLRALACLGWPKRHVIFAALKRPARRLPTVLLLSEYEALKEFYEKHHMEFGPNRNIAAQASRKGYPPPLAWAEGEIYDPAAHPSGWLTRSNNRDPKPFLINAVIRGERLAAYLNDAERAAVVKELSHMSNRGMERLTGISHNVIAEIRAGLLQDQESA